MTILLLDLPVEVLALVLDDVTDTVDWCNALLSCRTLCSLVTAKEKTRRNDALLYLGLRRFDPKRLPRGATVIVGRRGSGKTNALLTLMAELKCDHWRSLVGVAQPNGRHLIAEWRTDHAELCSDPESCRSACVIDDVAMTTAALWKTLQQADSFAHLIVTMQHDFTINHALAESNLYYIYHGVRRVWILEPLPTYIRDFRDRGYIDDKTILQLGQLCGPTSWLVFNPTAACPLRVWPNVPLFVQTETSDRRLCAERETRV